MFSFDEDRFYTMPPFFGGSPVRRKIALLDCQGVSLTVETDPGAVGKILPEGFEMERPEINLSFEHCASPSWLEGRDVNIASAGVPVRYTGNDEGLSGMLLLAVWIDEFSTVTVLREETGTPAMYADISLSKPGGSIFTASLGGKQPFLRSGLHSRTDAGCRAAAGHQRVHPQPLLLLALYSQRGRSRSRAEPRRSEPFPQDCHRRQPG